MEKVTILFILMASFLASSCLFPESDEDPFVLTQSSYEEVRMSRTDFENAISLEKSKMIKVSGKIYIKDHLLFINEVRKGFHVYDNTDPTNPIPLQFLAVPGATDLAIRNNALFVNQATDLISLLYDFDEKEVVVTKRIKDVFPPLLSPDGFYPSYTDTNEIVVNWILKN